jgi:hypothetical protein
MAKQTGSMGADSDYNLIFKAVENKKDGMFPMSENYRERLTML